MFCIHKNPFKTQSGRHSRMLLHIGWHCAHITSVDILNEDSEGACHAPKLERATAAWPEKRMHKGL